MRQKEPNKQDHKVSAPPNGKKFRHIYRVDSFGKKEVHAWLLNIRRKGPRGRFQKWFFDNGNPDVALHKAIEARDKFLETAPPPYWSIRPSKQHGVFERKRGKHHVVTVHVPAVLQKEIGHEAIDHRFDPNDPNDRKLTWKLAQQLRAELVDEALKKLPPERPSKRWPGQRA